MNGVLTPVWAALTFSGLLWAVWARWTMGSEWRGTPEVRADHRLITSGYGQTFFVNSAEPNKTNIVLFATQGILFTRGSISSCWVSFALFRVEHCFECTLNVIYAGNALYGGHWLALLMAGVIIGTYEYKIGVEERMLTKHFGSKYVDYQKRTPRIVPFCNFF